MHGYMFHEVSWNINNTYSSLVLVVFILMDILW